MTTTTLLSLPIFRAFDSAGLPLAGGLLYTYAAGTTTPLATYSDAAGASPNTNPVVLDSTGSATVRMGTSAYKFVLKDSLGSTQWTEDNLIPPATALSGLTPDVNGDYTIAAPTSGVAFTVNASPTPGDAVLVTGGLNASIDLEVQNTTNGANATAILDVHDGSTNYGFIELQSAAANAQITGGITGSAVNIGSSSAIPVVLATNNTSRMQIAGTGAVSIQTPTSGNAFAVPNGLVGTPSITFNNSLTSGFYRIGADRIGIALNGILNLDMQNSIWQLNGCNVTLTPPPSGVPLTVQASPTAGNNILITGSKNFGLNNTVQNTNTGASATAIQEVTDGTVFGYLQLQSSGASAQVTGGATGSAISIGGTGNFPVQITSNNTVRISIAGGGATTVVGNLSCNNVAPPGQVTGFGTPTGTGVIANFPGASATLAQTSQAVAQIIKDLKAFGLYGA